MPDLKDILARLNSPKELLRFGVIGFGGLAFLQFAGRPDVVGAEPVVGPYTSLALSLLCLVLLEVYSWWRRREHLDEQREVAEQAVQSEPPREG